MNEASLPANNHHMHGDHLGEGGERAKADRNTEAVLTKPMQNTVPAKAGKGHRHRTGLDSRRER